MRQRETRNKKLSSWLGTETLVVDFKLNRQITESLLWSRFFLMSYFSPLITTWLCEPSVLGIAGNAVCCFVAHGFHRSVITHFL